MKTRYLLVTLAIGLGLALALLWVMGGQTVSAVTASNAAGANALNAPAAELHVCPSGCPYSSVQAAVDAAGDGDVIKVAAGVYTDVHVRTAPPYFGQPPSGLITQVVYIDQVVTIQGGYTTTDWTTPDPEANPTILDAQGQGRVLVVDHYGVTIAGLHITGGDAAGLKGGPRWAGDVGGGIYLAARTEVTINNNWIIGNIANVGGGVWGLGGEVVLSANRVFSNSAQWFGGGVYLERSNDVLSENVIRFNTAQIGGGAFFTGSPTLVNNVLADNQVSDMGGGLAMFVHDSCFPGLLHNTIARNQGGDGSGVVIFDFPLALPSNCTMALTNTILADQSVGVSIISSYPNTVTVDGILWHNVPMTVSYSAPSVVTVLNQYTGEPAFAADGYHLTAGSAAINRGIDAGVTVDIDGEPRPSGDGYDLGADEIQWRKVYMPLMLRP